ncbi:MAG: hypothetical protein FWG46_07345 [Treponema sp.]|nr:hypothetical protein [Treponema sp.]
MKRTVPIMVIMLLLCSLPCRAQEELDNLFTLDFLSYTLTGLLHQGWGIGLNYEKKLFDFLSVKGTVGHMTFLTGIKDVYNTSVSLSAFFNYYPLSNGLDKLYVSAGGGTDFMNYFGKGELPPTEQDTLIHVTPRLGWKFRVKDFLMIDVAAGYKFIIFDTENYHGIKDYVSTGFRVGLSCVLLFNELKINKSKRENDNNQASAE